MDSATRGVPHAPCKERAFQFVDIEAGQNREYLVVTHDPQSALRLRGMDLQLDGKVAVVTGATVGIGRGIA